MLGVRSSSIKRLLPAQVLALELLKVLLENSGRVFASSEKFADGIKHYLCLSLLKNCASANPHALRLSCSIFLTLISKFRHSLKAEVGKRPENNCCEGGHCCRVSCFCNTRVPCVDVERAC